MEADGDMTADGTSSKKTLVVLGATGDLAGRLLLPALGQLLDAPDEGRELVLIGSGSQDWSQDDWRHRVEESFEAGRVSDSTCRAVLDTTRYQRADATDRDELRGLLDQAGEEPVLYFALPPRITAQTCEELRGVQLPVGTELVLEKPFGGDQRSAVELNAVLADLVPEHRVFRVDHFLGKSTVLNLLGLRFANRMFEPLWSAEHIERVDLIYDETLTLENRATYYDSAGALRDMIQSHLLQVLALIAMDEPNAVTADELRDAKAKVLRACRPWGNDPVTVGASARSPTTPTNRVSTRRG